MGRGPHMHRVAAGLVLAALAVGGPAIVAAEPLDSIRLEPPPLDVAPTLAPGLRVDGVAPRPASLAAGIAEFRRGSESRRFFSTHLMPRFERQFAEAMRVEAAPLVGHGLADHALYDWMTDDAATRAERATRKAVRDSLLETTTIARLVSWAETRGESLPGGGAASGRRGVDVDLGISGGLPRLTLSRQVGEGQVRAGVSLRGTAGVSFAHPRLHGLQLNAGWDAADDRVDLGCRLSF